MRQNELVLELSDEVRLTKTAGSIKALDDRTIKFVASHEVVDADSEVVKVHGIDTARFRQNPVLLLMHNWQSVPVATVTNLWVSPVDGSPALMGTAHFPDRPQSNDALADVRAGLLRGISIGFASTEQGPPILAGQRGRTHLKSVLLEISLVSLPSCPTCLVSIKSCTCGSSRKENPMNTAVLTRQITNHILDELADQLAAPLTRAYAKEVSAVESRTARYNRIVGEREWRAERAREKHAVIQQIMARQVGNGGSQALIIRDETAPHGQWVLPVSGRDVERDRLVKELLALL